MSVELPAESSKPPTQVLLAGDDLQERSTPRNRVTSSLFSLERFSRVRSRYQIRAETNGSQFDQTLPTPFFQTAVRASTRPTRV